MDWRSKGSDAEKLRLIKERWKNSVPNYQVFELGGANILSPLDYGRLTSLFFYGTRAGRGDIEIFFSSELSGERRIYVLVLHGATSVEPSIELRGHFCPLYAVGRTDPLARNASELDPLHLNFRRLFEVPADPPLPVE